VLRIPLIFWWPGGILPGTRIPGLVCQIDIFPTLLDICGLPREPSSMGTSLAPVLLGSEQRVPYRMALSELKRARGRSARAIQDNQFKLIISKKRDSERVMLFDLVADPAELNDRSKAMPGRTQQMLEALETVVAAVRGRALEGSQTSMDDETRDALRSLGYVD
jgi:arylsulfatase A-like enzyme